MARKRREPTAGDQGPIAARLGRAPGDQGSGKRRAAVEALARARAAARKAAPFRVNRRFARKRRKAGYGGRPR